MRYVIYSKFSLHYYTKLSIRILIQMQVQDLCSTLAQLFGALGLDSGLFWVPLYESLKNIRVCVKIHYNKLVYTPLC